MPRRKEPLAVLESRGRVHTAKGELDRRRQAEAALSAPRVGAGSRIRSPAWLPAELREEFNELRAQLVEAGIFAKLDRDALGRYLVASRSWAAASRQVQAALDAEDAETAAAWSTIQDKFFKQARACANDLGLTITSRCRLAAPKKETDPEEADFLKLLEGRRKNA